MRNEDTKEQSTEDHYMKALGDTVASLLRGVPVYLVGDDGAAIAPALRYLEHHSYSMIRESERSGLASADATNVDDKTPDDQISDTEDANDERSDGEDANSESADDEDEDDKEAEAAIFKDSSTSERFVLGTLGYARGAAANPNNWSHLHGGVTVWLDSRQTQRSSEIVPYPESPEPLGFTKSDLVVRFRLPDDATWQPTMTRLVSKGVLEGLRDLLEGNEHLTEKKRAYVQRGCRGDWPDLEKPGADVTPGHSHPPTSALVKDLILTREQEVQVIEEHEEELERFCLANFGSDFTGLPMCICVSENYLGHAPHVKVDRQYTNKPWGNWFSLMFTEDGESNVVGDTGEISERDVELVKKYIKHNKEVLERFWEQRECFDAFDIVNGLKKVPDGS